METMEKKKPRPRRAVHRRVQSRDRRALPEPGTLGAQVAQDFDLTESAVRGWVKQAEIDAGRAATG